MAVPAQRRLDTPEIRRFGGGRDPLEIPDLTAIQTASYARFLQYSGSGVPSQGRKDEGLESVLQEIFPIESYDKSINLEYLHYELGKPRYDPDECRQLRLTYGRPFRIWLRLNKGDEPVEEEVYLGDLPVMLGGGEFIINGAERVVVSQLHRSPGIDFVSEVEAGERKVYSCRVIPERGSWIEINTTKKDTITVRIDQSGKFSGRDAAAGDGSQVLARLGHPQGVLRLPRSRRSSTAAVPRRSKARLPSTILCIRSAAIGPARSSSSAGTVSPRIRPS